MHSHRHTQVHLLGYMWVNIHLQEGSRVHPSTRRYRCGATIHGGREQELKPDRIPDIRYLPNFLWIIVTTMQFGYGVVVESVERDGGLFREAVLVHT